MCITMHGSENVKFTFCLFLQNFIEIDGSLGEFYPPQSNISRTNSVCISCLSLKFTYSTLPFLPSKRYNLCKVLARSTTSFHLSLSCATFFPAVYTQIPYVSQNIFPTCFGPPNWSFGHGFPSLNFSVRCYPQAYVRHALTSLVFVF
jgi:hypothetical protein